jgi:glycosyltransferase involved in cell wall biosynthesis
MKAFVHLGYGFDALKYRERYIAGLVPDVVPYGFHHAEAQGCDLTFSRDFHETALSSWHRRFWRRMLGFDLVHAWRNRKAAAAADIVWTMEEIEYLAILFLCAFLPSLHGKKIIAQTVWLFDGWKAKSWLRRRFLLFLLKRASCLTVHSANYLNLPIAPTKLLPFGISLDSFPHSSTVRPVHSPIRVLAMGTDPTRDWTTFLDAFGGDTRFEAIGVSKRLTAEMVEPFSNVSIRRNPSMETFRELYRWADFVVVPMLPNLYSGITVALEAVSMGVPVISAATGGVPTYFEPGEVLYVAAEDPADLRDAVLNCSDEQRKQLVEKAQARFQREDYSSAGMASRYMQLSKELLQWPVGRPTGHGSYPAPPSRQSE